jgi:hypothetical protein
MISGQICLLGAGREVIGVSTNFSLGERWVSQIVLGEIVDQHRTESRLFRQSR